MNKIKGFVKKNYKVVIGSSKNFEFGVKMEQISLTELQSN